MANTTERPDIKQWLPLIRRKCTEVAREYPGYVELEDLVQEVAVWWLTTKPEHLWEYLRDDDDKMRLRRCVWRVADSYAKKAKAWFGPEGRFVQVRYSGRLVMEMMPVALDPDGLPDGGGVPDGPRAHGNLAEGGDVIASLIDVRQALERGLAEEDQLYLLQVQAARWNYDLLGVLHGVEADTVRRRVARIAQRCANWLNNEEDEAA